MMRASYLAPALALCLALVPGMLFSASASAQVACSGRLATMEGTPGPDNITGTEGNDVISGGDGDDIIDGAGGDDVICGGSGDDTISGGEGNDDLLGGPGNDSLTGDAGDDVHQGGPGNDICNGVSGIDAADSDCGTRENMDVDIIPVVLHALDGTPLAGELYTPAGDLAAAGTRRVAMVHSHGAQGNYGTGVPRLAGLYGSTRGFTVLALNRRDWGEDAGGGDTLFEDATRDLGVGVDFLELLGFSQVFIGGHSQGTTNAGVYPAHVPDSRLVGVGLYGAISDARISAENVVYSGYYDQHVVTANELIASGDGSTVVGWMTGFGVDVFRSARAWLSYYGPDTLAVVEREITDSPVPVLLLRADGDAFTIGPWSRAIRDAALNAGVDATYTILPYPASEFDLSNFGGNAHGFLGVEREMIATTLDWLSARVPETTQFTTTIAYPEAVNGNYPPYAHAGADQVSNTSEAMLDGRRSTDIDGDIALYQWVQVDGPALSLDDPTSATPVVTTDAAGEQLAAFQLTVTDNDGATASDSVQVMLDGGTAVVRDDDGSSADFLLLLILVASGLGRHTRKNPRNPK